MEAKTLKNTDQDAAKKNVSDLVVFGGDLFKLLSKASSEKEGWMKSTKAMSIEGVGCVVQVTTQQLNDTGMYKSFDAEGAAISDYSDGNTITGSVIAEAATFVPGVRIEEKKDEKGIVTSRKLVAIR